MSRELTPSMRRSVLIAALRDPSMWPEGFEFNWEFCDKCAMGLARRLFNITISDSNFPSRSIGPMLGLDMPQRAALFLSARCMTPLTIADRLEQIHRELEGVS